MHIIIYIYIYKYICHIYFQIVRVGLPEVQPVLSTISLRPEVQGPSHPKKLGFHGYFRGI